MKWAVATVSGSVLALVVAGVLGSFPASGSLSPGSASSPAAASVPRHELGLIRGQTWARVLYGFGEQERTRWTGRFTVRGARVVSARIWRPTRNDTVREGEFQVNIVRARSGTRGRTALVPNGLVIVLSDVRKGGRLTFETNKGNFAIPLDRVRPGNRVVRLKGRVRAEWVPAVQELAASELEEDFPAAALGPDGTGYVAYIAHEHVGPKRLARLRTFPEDLDRFRPSGGGDQLLLLWNRRGWSAPMVLTDRGLDLWRPTVAVDGENNLHVVWSQRCGGNWELFHRTFHPDRALGRLERLTNREGADINARAVRAADGTVWIAWQGWKGADFQIFVMPLEEGVDPIEIGQAGANEWNPDIAADSSGRVYVVYDTYARGNYDVRLAVIDTAKRAVVSIQPVADSPRFEANAAVACDREGRVWVAWETRGYNWGKDQGAHYRLTGVLQPGTRLYAQADVHLGWWDGKCWRYPRTTLRAAMRPRFGRRPGQMSFPRLAVDGQGRVWLTFRKRERWVGPAGTYWQTYVTSYDQRGWLGPIEVAYSDNLLDNRPGLIGLPDGGLLLCMSTDKRLRALNADQIGNDLLAAVVEAQGAPGEPEGQREHPTLVPDFPPPPAHPNEDEDVARLRRFRLKLGGKTYRIARGEFHRHTEISADGGGDGALEDMWRYALDAARMDWLGCGDHDNGGGREYTWWLTQKTTDIFYHPPTFFPVFSYERSVGYPDGHRNVMFAQRGIRVLPRLAPQKGEPRKPNGVSVRDTAMLYRYLEHFGGICASHTSATDMGTDWRDWDAGAEPVVEIYQGARQNYEHRGAPRSATGPDDSIGGWRPLGFVWRAFLKGHRLGFQSSSDHGSTHISYGMVFVEEASREGVVDGFRKRHCYAATDNILLVVTSGDHLMGDEFKSKAPIKLQVRVVGTAPIKQIDVIKDFTYVYAVRPGKVEHEFEWTDRSIERGKTSWYYVRVIQVDGQLAWASPMWVTYE